ncbi:MAG: response regulator [Dehalococcoidia bacterium]
MAQKLSALVVEPDPDARLDTSRAVEEMGFDVAGQASYGTEATFLAAQQRPNVILLALEDPPTRGIATLEALQRLAPDTPVIAYSSAPKADLMRRAMRSGARDFLEKPLRPDPLREAVYTVLSQEEQRQMARWAETSAETARGSVIAVVSAKGGVGKSTIASNLALALKQLTVQEVVLVDADVQFGESALLLDAVDLDMSMLDLVRNEAEFTRQSIAGYLRRHETGLDMLAAPLEPPDWRAVRPEQLVAISQGLAEGHEYVILDTPSLLLEVTNAALHEAAEVLLVTSLELTSIKSTKTALRMLESWSIPSDRIRLIINNSTRATGLTADDVAGATAIDVTLTIGFDPKVGETSQSGVPIVLSDPDSPFASSIDTLARQLAGMPLESARSGSGRSRFGLLRRRRKASNDAAPDAAPAEQPSVEAEPAADAAVDQLPASGEAVRSE